MQESFPLKSTNLLYDNSGGSLTVTHSFSQNEEQSKQVLTNSRLLPTVETSYAEECVSVNDESAPTQCKDKIRKTVSMQIISRQLFLPTGNQNTGKNRRVVLYVKPPTAQSDTQHQPLPTISGPISLPGKYLIMKNYQSQNKPTRVILPASKKQSTAPSVNKTQNKSQNKKLTGKPDKTLNSVSGCRTFPITKPTTRSETRKQFLSTERNFSVVWKYFKKSGNRNRPTATCNICGHVGKQHTGDMRYHIKMKHPVIELPPRPVRRVVDRPLVGSLPLVIKTDESRRYVSLPTSMISQENVTSVVPVATNQVTTGFVQENTAHMRYHITNKHPHVKPVISVVPQLVKEESCEIGSPATGQIPFEKQIEDYGNKDTGLAATAIVQNVFTNALKQGSEEYKADLKYEPSVCGEINLPSSEQAMEHSDTENEIAPTHAVQQGELDGMGKDKAQGSIDITGEPQIVIQQENDALSTNYISPSINNNGNVKVSTLLMDSSEVDEYMEKCAELVRKDVRQMKTQFMPALKCSFSEYDPNVRLENISERSSHVNQNKTSMGQGIDSLESTMVEDNLIPENSVSRNEGNTTGRKASNYCEKCNKTFADWGMFEHHMIKYHDASQRDLLIEKIVKVDDHVQLLHGVKYVKHKYPSGVIFYCLECLLAYSSQALLEKHILDKHNEHFMKTCGLYPDGTEAQTANEGPDSHFSEKEVATGTLDSDLQEEPLKSDIETEQLLEDPNGNEDSQSNTNVTNEKQINEEMNETSDETNHNIENDNKSVDRINDNKEANKTVGIPKGEINFDCKRCSSRFPTWRTFYDHSCRGKKAAIKLTPPLHKRAAELQKRNVNSKATLKLVIKPQASERFEPNIDSTTISELQKENTLETCDICRETTQDLDQHQKKHTKLSYVCEYCGYQTNKTQNFNQHINNVHLKLRPFKCPHPLCNKRFFTKAMLTGHMTVHTSERKCQCVKCGKRYKSEGYLRQHMISHRPADRRHRCPYCTGTFSYACNMKTHIRNIHQGAKDYTVRRERKKDNIPK